MSAMDRMRRNLETKRMNTKDNGFFVGRPNHMDLDDVRQEDADFGAEPENEREDNNDPRLDTPL